MLRSLRRRRLVHILALTMQLCMAWMSVSALLHSDDDDALCNPVVVLHDHAAHHIGAASKELVPQQDHCFICHNLSLRSLVSTTSIAAPVVAAQSLATSCDVAVTCTPLARRPARAPPLV